MFIPWHVLSYEEKRLIRAKRRFLFILFFVLFLFYQVIVSFCAKPYRMKSSGMAPTIEQGDLLLIQPLLKGLKKDSVHSIKRGDIVLLQNFCTNKRPFWLYLLEPCLRFVSFQQAGFATPTQKVQLPDFLLKRVIALPGDKVKIENGQIYVQPAGSMHFLSEFEASSQVYELTEGTIAPHWKGLTSFSSDFGSFLLKEDEIFVLGDNRSMMNDSRTLGPFTLKQVKGKVLNIYWPVTKIKQIEHKK